MTKFLPRKVSRETSAIAAGMMLAPMVVSMRLPLMAADTQRATLAGTETMLAFTEKTAAVAEGALAAQLSLFQSALRFWPEVLSGRTPSIMNGVAAERSLNAALKPVGRRVKANFRRLSAKA
jgi:hypothetical protein